MVTANLGRVRPIHRGEYDPVTNYVPLDIVTLVGRTFFCIAPTVGNAPSDTTKWAQIADFPIPHERVCTYGGTANAILLTSGLGLAQIPKGFKVVFNASAANTGAMTASLDGLPAKPVKTITGADTPSGFIRVTAAPDFVTTEMRWSSDGDCWIARRAPETGSNSNGTFTRLEDGTVFMEGSLNGAPVENSSGGVYRSNELTVTYPISVSSPRTNINVSSALRWANMITSSAYRQWAGASSATASSAIYNSTARWY